MQRTCRDTGCRRILAELSNPSVEVSGVLAIGGSRRRRQSRRIRRRRLTHRRHRSRRYDRLLGRGVCLWWCCGRSFCGRWRCPHRRNDSRSVFFFLGIVGKSWRRRRQYNGRRRGRGLAHPLLLCWSFVSRPKLDTLRQRRGLEFRQHPRRGDGPGSGEQKRKAHPIASPLKKYCCRVLAYCVPSRLNGGGALRCRRDIKAKPAPVDCIRRRAKISSRQSRTDARIGSTEIPTAGWQPARSTPRPSACCGS